MSREHPLTARTKERLAQKKAELIELRLRCEAIESDIAEYTVREALADHADKMERNAKEMTDHVVRIREFLAMLDSVPGLSEACDTAPS